MYTHTHLSVLRDVPRYMHMHKYTYTYKYKYKSQVTSTSTSTSTSTRQVMHMCAPLYLPTCLGTTTSSLARPSISYRCSTSSHPTGCCNATQAGKRGSLPTSGGSSRRAIAYTPFTHPNTFLHPLTPPYTPSHPLTHPYTPLHIRTSPHALSLIHI